jgi:glucan phosphoethanolaminetransferase (alkaline phosphatase superfamily)
MSSEKEISEIPRAPVNYLFFGFYFAIIAIIHVFHVFLIESVATLSTCFFVVYAIAQCAMETLGLILIVGMVINYFPKIKNLFVLVVFFLFISHLIDFPLVRLMDMTFWYALNFVTQMSYSNFFELLLASNVSILVWVIAGLIGISLLLSGLFLYRMTEKWAMRRKLFISAPMLGGSLCVIGLFLLSWDYSVKGHISRTNFDRFQKTLPWKCTFFPYRVDYLSLKTTLKELQGEEELMRSLDSRVFSLARKPDIYLFIVESLREDYITFEIAPNLTRFKKDYFSFELALSNANATHISWFSLFQSQFPFYWGKVDPEEIKGGSLPLQLLKKIGYKVYVSSSARLAYFQMNRVIFGEGEHLADALFLSDDEDCNELYERDQKAIDNLLLEMQKGGSGRIFIIFLDATHHDYSWPSEMSKFFPFEEKINYINVAMSKKGLEKIKNRYRNALYFIDDQFGKFLKALENAPGGKDAVVVITGDHGEEFYEHGNLFHASGLSEPQIHVPLYYRFGQNETLHTDCKMTCHMDIFPTLFHYLIGEDLMGDILQGESIFKTHRWPYTIVARFNAISSPYEFCIHNGTNKLLATFSDERNIFNSKGLKIISTKNCQDETIVKELNVIHDEFGPALERIFPTSIK